MCPCYSSPLFKDTFLHRIFCCWYCIPSEKRPRKKVRPPRKSNRSEIQRISSTKDLEAQFDNSPKYYNNLNSIDLVQNEEITPALLLNWTECVLNEELVQRVQAVYQFIIIGEIPDYYYLDLKYSSRGSVGKGTPPDGIIPDVTLTCTSHDMKLLFDGKLSKLGAYMTGRLKVDGDKSAAMNLDFVIEKVQAS